MRKNIIARKEAIRDAELASHRATNPEVYSRAAAGDPHAQKDLDWTFQEAERKGEQMAATLPLMAASVPTGAAVGAGGGVALNHLVGTDEAEAEPKVAFWATEYVKTAYFPSEGLMLGALGGTTAGHVLSHRMGPVGRWASRLGGGLAGGAAGFGVDTLRKSKEDDQIRRAGEQRALMREHGLIQ